MLKSMRWFAGLSLVLFVSGAAGLSYEVVWLRSLTNALGSSSLAMATLLAVFMGGMAAGSLVLGRFVDRFKRPLLVYAVLELILALCAVTVPFAMRLVPHIDFLAPSDATGAVSLMSKALAASVILLVPTFVMGGTLPALGAALGRQSGRPGVSFSLLYGIHVVGAATGALLASFLLIGEIGLATTSMLGAGANVAAALGAWLIGRTPAESTTQEEVTPGEPVVPAVGPSATPWLATAFLSGLVLLGSEVVCFRVLVLALMAKAHSFALMLAVFLIGLSIGSFLVGLVPARVVRRPGFMGAVLLVGAGGILLARSSVLQVLPILLAAGRPPESGADASGFFEQVAAWIANGEAQVQSGEYVLVSLAISGIALLPLAIPLGMVLPAVMRCIAFRGLDDGRMVGRVVFWNTLGSVTGPLLFTFGAIPALSLLGTLWAAAALVALVGALWLTSPLRRGSPAVRSTTAVGVIAGLWLLILAPKHLDGTPELDLTRLGEAVFRGGEPAKVLHHLEGATCTVSIVEDESGKRSIRIDGFEAAATSDAKARGYHYMRVMSHLPMLLYGPNKARRALVICCGTGGAAGALTVYPLEEIELVDLHQDVLDCLPWFKTWNRDLASNQLCRKIADDGRAHLRRREDYYDVITLEPMPPRFVGMTQLYSVEFYQSCQRALRKDGVVCQWLPFHLVDREEGLAIVAAMKAVFSTVDCWIHESNGILIGTDRESLPLTKESLRALRSIPGAGADLLAAGIRNGHDIADRFACQASDLPLEGIDPVRDDRPFLEYKAIAYGIRLADTAERNRREEPFYRARLGTSIPLSGFTPQEEYAYRRSWRVRGIVRYALVLDAQGRRAEARSYVESQVAADPSLRNEQDLVRNVRHLFN